MRRSPGCSPAWRPDGVLTVAYEREVVRLRLPCRVSVCPVTLVSQRELRRSPAPSNRARRPRAPARARRRGRLALEHARGRQLSLPPHFREGHAFAWTQNEHFVAVATRFAVTVVDVASLDRYDTTGSGLRSVTLPLRVTELAWR